MYTKCIDPKRTQALHVLYKKCTKMCTFCIHFSSKCVLQNVYFINEHKKYINVYKMYRSQSALRQLMYYTKRVQKCVLFVYTLVPNVFYKMNTS